MTSSIGTWFGEDWNSALFVHLSIVVLLASRTDIEAQLREPHVVERAQTMALRDLFRFLRVNSKEEENHMASLASAMDVILCAAECGDLKKKFYLSHVSAN